MDDLPPPPDLAGVLARLENDPDALPWPERRALAQSLAGHLLEHPPDETVLALLFELAVDAKWEVRKDVADCLAHLPDGVFPRLAARLCGDSNAFVRQEAEKAIDRRRRGEASTRRRQRHLDHVQAEYADLQRAHGDQAADRARRLAERLYDILVGSTVHDMRALIVPLRSGLKEVREQLATGTPDHAVCAERLWRMARQVTMLELLLEDMRLYSQPTPLARRRERLAALVDEGHRLALDALRATDRDPAAVAVNLAVPAQLTVEVAPHQVIRVFGNVIKNAYESFVTPAGELRPGRIEVAARAVDAERVEVVVRDDGMGLPPDDLAEVRRFTPGCSSKKRYGTGFGLAIAKRKVDDHGGGLAIDSRVNAGTTVTITLPIHAKELDA